MEADMAWKFHVNTSSRETNFPLVGSKQAQQRVKSHTISGTEMLQKLLMRCNVLNDMFA